MTRDKLAEYATEEQQFNCFQSDEALLNHMLEHGWEKDAGSFEVLRAVCEEVNEAYWQARKSECYGR
jgi:hypothetical protein